MSLLSGSSPSDSGFGVGTQGNVGDRLAAELEHQMAGIGDPADHGEIQLPFGEDRLGLGLAAGLQHHQHPLLALRQHHLIGRHPLLPAGDGIHVELEPDPAFRRHLDR